MAVVADAIPLVGQHTATDDLIDELAVLCTEIARVGNNVNQIAHRLNAGGNPHPADTAVLAAAEHTLTVIHSALEAVDNAAYQTADARGRR